MGKKQRDCAGCGAPVGSIGRDLCCKCRRRDREQQARSSCLDCGKDRVVDAAQRCVLCSRRCRQCGHLVRSRETMHCRDCRRRAAAAAGKSPCPRCGKAGFIRSETGWCGSCSRPGPGKDPPRTCTGCGQLRRAGVVLGVLAAPSGSGVHPRRQPGRRAGRPAVLVGGVRRLCRGPAQPR